MNSARRGTGTATSSMRHVVPISRVPPTAGKIPLRMAHHLPVTAGSLVKAADEHSVSDASTDSSFRRFSATSSGVPSVITSTAPASSGSPASSGKSFSTVRIALRSKNSAAVSAPVAFIAATASHAACVVGKRRSADSLAGAIFPVRNVASARNRSVPSLPGMRRVMISNGSSHSANGRIVRPVTFLIEYLRRMRSFSSGSFCTRSRSSQRRFMKSGCDTANALRDSASPVSSTVPSANTTFAERIVRSAFACVPQLMPEALLSVMPPTIALLTDAGSGRNL